MKSKSMTITESVFKQNQLVSLVQDTPPIHIKQRKGRGGKQFRYVTGSYVQKILNQVFGWMWSFEVKSHGQSPSGQSIWALGTLTILNPETHQPMIIKEQFGSSEYKFETTYNEKNIKVKSDKEVDYADDLKAASTDALKKCSSLLGIAADVYADEDTANEITERAAQVRQVLIENKKKQEAALKKGLK